MIPSDLAARLRLLSESLVNPVAPVRGIPDELPELPIGQRFTARIESAQPDGTFRAIVAGRSLSLALPQPARAGDKLELVVSGRTPGLVAAQPAGAAAAPAALVVGQRFLARIESPLPDGTYRAQVAGSALTLALPEAAQAGESLELVVTALAPRLVSAQRADLAAAGRAALSPTGQLLGALLANAGQPPQAPTLVAAAPLLPQAPAEAAALAGALRQTLAESGLFYESHQAQWLAGRHPLEALRREPQARLARAAPGGAGATPEPGGSEALSATETTLARGSGAAGGSLAAELQTLVQQQLDAAATQQIVWRGELWPGQTLQWDIVAEERPDGQADEAAAPAWRTTLRLALPHLGEIAAELRLSGEKVGLAMTADAARVGGLRQGLDELAAAFAAAGLPPLAARVEAHEPA